MCYEVKCSKCGKASWGGCGLHVPSVYKRIPEGQHCQCKGWPGVKTSGENSGTTGADGGDGSKAASAVGFDTDGVTTLSTNGGTGISAPC